MAVSVRLRAAAARDIELIVVHLLDTAGPVVAARFVDDLEAAVGQLGRHPRSGSLRLSYDLDIPDLRAWPIRRSRYLAFYVVRASEVDVWRVLHERRDIGHLLADD